MRILLVFALFFILSCYAYPTINDNFISRAVVTIINPNNTIQLAEHWFEDANNQQIKVETFVSGSHVQVFQFYKNDTEYIDVDQKTCIHRKIDAPFIPLFDWLQHSKQDGACENNFVKGQRWTLNQPQGVSLSLCANGNDPLTFAVRNERTHTTNFVTYESFVPGNVSAVNFQLPARCF
eukprot:TRINITY_DN4519_c0_g1_i1.p1 TRINITY_DN4519_c0_g1~~TRINITY_DN4519_c0_g1_i1.p1  ORF type:complete len:189 (+),score=63.01 TRINITY_DN4519_c0_g1_i1:31-567(+)